MERLTFNVGSARDGQLVVSRRAVRAEAPPATSAAAAADARNAKRARAAERYDWDYLWMLTFTFLLFFRPQDDIPPLRALHLSELTAIAGLAAMAARRLATGESITKVNMEMIGVVMLGALMLALVPFSIWPGGSAHLFSDVYVKIILIFALMITTVNSPKRLRQMTWLIVVSSGYLSARAVFDYIRGVNLVEGDRVHGAVGGIFFNPNDLALNLVTFLAPTLFLAIQERRTSRRLLAAVIAALMLAAIVFTKSRGGFLGLLAMLGVVLLFTIRLKPGIAMAAVLAGAMALPVVPQSFWNRMNSIFDASEDPTGSREARIRLLEQGLQVFSEYPLTGVGPGQFQNYQSGDMIERWRVTHNVWLELAAEMGIFGFGIFLFLVVRAYSACRTTVRLLKGSPRRVAVAGRATPSREAPRPPPALDLTPDERQTLTFSARSTIAAMVGWSVCSFFASVAFNWTFYYVFALAVAGREIVTARLKARAPAEAPAAGARGFSGAEGARGLLGRRSAWREGGSRARKIAHA